jgi:hypothetical protein
MVFTLDKVLPRPNTLSPILPKPLKTEGSAKLDKILEANPPPPPPSLRQEASFPIYKAMASTFDSPVVPFQEKPLLNLSILVMAHFGNLDTNIKNVGIAERTDFTSNSLPGLEMRLLFHPSSMLPIF